MDVCQKVGSQSTEIMKLWYFSEKQFLALLRLLSFCANISSPKIEISKITGVSLEEFKADFGG